MRKIQTFFKETVSKIEDYPLPLRRYVLLFIALLSIRLCLEFFANQRLFKIEDVIHIGLWFIFIVLAFMIQLHFFSKVKMEHVIKLVVCCFTIALSAPIIDLIISQGKFSKMNYLSINSVGDFIWSYLTIGGASISRGATIGIRIEIILLVVASFNYILIKTGNVFRAVLGTVSIYTVLFLTGTIPYFIGKINALFQLSYGLNDQSSIYLIFTLDVILFLILVIRLDKKWMYFKLTSDFLFRILMTIIPLFIGAYFAREAYPNNWSLDPTSIYYFPLLFIVYLLMIKFESNLIVQSERLNGNNYQQQNGILILIFLTSACISFYTLFAVILGWAFLFLLYEEPFNVRRIPYFAEFLKSCWSSTFLFIGFMTFGGPMIGMELIHIIFSLMIAFSIYFVVFRLFRYFSD
jgi:hypothetical protein